jgi:hypothetical protein
MATKILIKNNSTAGSAPLTSDLERGELAINLADRKVYTKNNSDAIVTLGSAFVNGTAPSAPSEGDLWYDSTNNILKTYNGTSWDVSGYVYSAGTGIDITGTTITNTAPDQTVTLTEGSNVTITGTYPNFTIAATDTNTTYTAGTALDLVGTEFSVDLSELTTSTTDGDGDFFVVVDSVNAQRKLTKGNINLSGFNNDAGFITGYTETDTLDSVTDRGAVTTNAIQVGGLTATTGSFSSDVTVGGNLVVNGTTTTVNSNTVNIGDNIIVLNSDETGTPSQNAGFEVERGTSTNVQFIWNEANDAWDMGNYPLQNVTIDGGTY